MTSIPDLCNGGLVRLQKGGTFTATVASTETSNKVNVRWHYSADGAPGAGAEHAAYCRSLTTARRRRLRTARRLPASRLCLGNIPEPSGRPAILSPSGLATTACKKRASALMAAAYRDSRSIVLCAHP